MKVFNAICDESGARAPMEPGGPLPDGWVEITHEELDYQFASWSMLAAWAEKRQVEADATRRRSAMDDMTRASRARSTAGSAGLRPVRVPA